MSQWNPQRILIYTLAILLPPVLLGVFLGVTSLSKVMIRRPPKPIEISADWKPAPAPANSRGRVLILASNVGTEITDMAAVAEVFGRSDFEVYTAAPERRLSATTGPIELMPTYSLKEAPEADVLAIPALLQWQDPALVEAVRARAVRAKLILCLGEGVRICTLAGLLEGGRATSHFVSLPELEKTFKNVRWFNGPNVVEYGRVISSAGIVASIDAALIGLEHLAGRETATKVAKTLGHAMQEQETERAVRPADGLALLLQAAYNWSKQYVAIWLEPGASELGLAGALDTLPRTFGVNAFTLSRGRQLVRTLNGLDFVANEALESVFPADFLIIPAAGPSPLFSNGGKPAEDLRSYIEGYSVRLRDDSALRPAASFEATLRWITEEPRFAETAPVVRVVSKFVVLTTEPQELPNRSNVWFLIRPLLVSALGVALVRIFERRIKRKKTAVLLTA